MRLGYPPRCFQNRERRCCFCPDGYDSGGKALDAQEAVSFIKEALAYSGIRKLDVVIEDKEDCEVETIDLLSNVAKYVLPFNYSMSNPITHERLYFNLKSEIIKDEK